MSEITEADYRAITDLAHELHSKIHYLMARTNGPRDTAWNELYELMQLSNIIGTASGRYADRAQLPREPVAYQPVDWAARLVGGQ